MHCECSVCLVNSYSCYVTSCSRASTACEPPGVGQVCTRYPPPHYHWRKRLFITRTNNVNKARRCACNNTSSHLNVKRGLKKSIVTFGHVSPRTLRSKVPAKSFPPWNGVMRVTVDPTSRFPAGTNLARMIRRASPFWIFCHVSFNISYPLSLFPSLAHSLSLSPALRFSFARSQRCTRDSSVSPGEGADSEPGWT